MEFAEQAGYRCRLEWGRRGARDAAARGDILVIVDVLRFSTTVATAVHRGGEIYPCLEEEDLVAAAVRMAAAPATSVGFNLSPCGYQGLAPGSRIALASLNGASCSRFGSRAPHLFVAGLVNRGAVAAVVNNLLDRTLLAVTVIACGEQWSVPDEGERLRFAVEDYLGAGAVLAALGHSRSPEAQVCASAFHGMQDRLLEALRDCASGRELTERGKGADVAHAAQLDVYQAVPVLREGVITCW